MVIVRFSDMYCKVENGEKRQTIRPADTYQHIDAGDKIHAYSTKKIEESPRPVVDELLFEGECVFNMVVPWVYVQNNDRVARLDGFEDYGELEEWFKDKYGSVPDPGSEWRIIRWI